MEDGFAAVIGSVPAKARQLAEKAKALICAVYPEAVEVAWPKQSVVGYGVGPKKMSEHFVYLLIAADHINVGFYYGAELPDPAHMLAGEGKLLRHVQINDLKQLDDPNLKELIRQAAGYLPKLPPDDPRPLRLRS